jgi:hypothetical protein
VKRLDEPRGDEQPTTTPASRNRAHLSESLETFHSANHDTPSSVNTNALVVGEYHGSFPVFHGVIRSSFEMGDNRAGGSMKHGNGMSQPQLGASHLMIAAPIP